MKETNLIESLVKAQSEMTHAQLDQINPQWKSKFASLKSVIDAVKTSPKCKRHFFYADLSPRLITGVGIETSILQRQMKSYPQAWWYGSC